MARKSQMKLTQAEAKKLEDAKLKICLAVRRSMARQRYGMSSTFLAIMLGTSRGRVCIVQRGATKNVTFNQLFRFLVKLEPNFEILIAI